MKFILIYWLVANASGYAPTGTVEFNDEASCTAALKQVVAVWTFDRQPGVCVAKGQELATVTVTGPAQLQNPPAAGSGAPAATNSPPAPTPVHP